MILTVTLNATTDLVININNLTKGKVLRTNSIFSYPGGKGTNVARALSELGAKVYATGFCGDKNYNAMNNFLKKYNIINKFIKSKGENRYCVLITEKENKNETIINSESNFHISKNDIKIFFLTVKKLSNICKYTVLSGSLPLCLPDNFYELIIKNIKNFTYILLDTSYVYLKKGIRAAPDVIKLNIEELQNTFNIRFKTKNSLKKFISFLSEKHNISTMLITLNEKGAILYDKTNFYYFKPHFLKVKNILSPVGCGDAFSAGFIFGISQNKDKIYSTKLAMACAAANLSHTGSCFIKKDEIYYFLTKIKYKKY